MDCFQFRREDAILRHRIPGTLPVEEDFGLGELLRKNILIGGDHMIDRVIKCKCVKHKTNLIQKPGTLYTSDPVRYWMVVDLLLIVEFAKTFDAFRKLDDYDQKCLITHIGGVLHVATQSFYSYHEAKSCTLTFPDGLNAFERKMVDMRKDEKRYIFKDNFECFLISALSVKYLSTTTQKCITLRWMSFWRTRSPWQSTLSSSQFVCSLQVKETRKRDRFMLELQTMWTWLLKAEPLLTKNVNDWQLFSESTL